MKYRKQIKLSRAHWLALKIRAVAESEKVGRRITITAVIELAVVAYFAAERHREAGHAVKTGYYGSGISQGYDSEDYTPRSVEIDARLWNKIKYETRGFRQTMTVMMDRAVSEYLASDGTESDGAESDIDV